MFTPSSLELTVSSVVTAPESTSVAVRATDLVKVYGSGSTQVRALESVSVDIGRGEFTAIMGPSGSGKSTLMHCLAGLDTVDSGTIELNGIDVTSLKERDRTLLRRDSIGFVFQAFNLVPSLTAKENINLPSALAGRKPDAAWLDELIGTLGIGDRLSHLPSELSGGQQQRVAVARALASRPAIVFADEPTGNLDSTSGAELLAFLRTAVRELGQTIVMVTHDPVAAAHAGHAVFLADGQIVAELAEPTVESILDRIRSLEG
jgi:putative ABC transport system ATP-binding protein